jgi:hypothetical protein
MLHKDKVLIDHVRCFAEIKIVYLLTWVLSNETYFCQAFIVCVQQGYLQNEPDVEGSFKNH